MTFDFGKLSGGVASFSVRPKDREGVSGRASFLKERLTPVNSVQGIIIRHAA